MLSVVSSYLILLFDEVCLTAVAAQQFETLEALAAINYDLQLTFTVCICRYHSVIILLLANTFKVFGKNW